MFVRTLTGSAVLFACFDSVATLPKMFVSCCQSTDCEPDYDSSSSLMLGVELSSLSRSPCGLQRRLPSPFAALLTHIIGSAVVVIRELDTYLS